jgi:hypothetical protein
LSAVIWILPPEPLPASASAWIRRVEPSAALAERLAQSDAARAAFVYAENGFWYDAFRAASPAQRDGLLAQVGLGTIVRAEAGEGPRGVLTAEWRLINKKGTDRRTSALRNSASGRRRQAVREFLKAEVRPLLKRGR